MFYSKNTNHLCLKLIIVPICLFSLVWADDSKVNPPQTPKVATLDPELSLVAAEKIPANQWVINEPKIVIPEKWDKGRYIYINTYASIIYCDSLNVAITMDGYTYTPAGKSAPNNYSDSVYTFDPIKNEYELFKRSNWMAGGRTKDPEKASYPLDENKSDPTPCPRHIYKGVTWSSETNSFYLINGANAGVPNEHPKYKENNGTTTNTFWALDMPAKAWKQLEIPPLKRIDSYETMLVSIPGTGKLIYLDDWSIASFDCKEAKWAILRGNEGKPIKALQNGSATLVDSKRKRIVFYGGIAWKSVKEAPPQMASNQLHVYDVEKNKFEIIDGKGTVEFEKIRPCAYLANIDKYFFLTDKGNYLFDPTNNQWTKLNIDLPPLPLRWCYMTYDTKRGIIIINEGKKWGVLRLDEKSLKPE